MEEERVLRVGMRGEDVRQVKERLVALGWLKAATHDRFGTDTRAAVIAFQRSAGLAADGAVGDATRTALFQDRPPARRAEPSPRAVQLCALALTRLGDVYGWGQSGLAGISEPKLVNRDKSVAEGRRAVAFWQKQLARGYTGLMAHDCSGFVSYLLREVGAWNSRRDCDNLYALCEPVGKTALIAGDLTFRFSGRDAFHIGIYIGRGRVIHAKGRDVGVVMEGIDGNGTGYWNGFGRCRLLAKEGTA